MDQKPSKVKNLKRKISECSQNNEPHKKTAVTAVKNEVIILDEDEGFIPSTKLMEDLLKMENVGIVFSIEKFVCPICLLEIEPGHGVILKECIHSFCIECIKSTINFCEDSEIKCPYKDDEYSCEMIITEREIRHLLTTDDFEKYLQKSIRYAEQKIELAFHCQSPDCSGWCIYDYNSTVFRCPVCEKVNCLSCKDIHEGYDCRTYQDLIKVAGDDAGKKTKEKLAQLLITGKAMQCPKCRIAIVRITGCDGMICSMCKTEICWATKGYRWGPNGKGDLTGGCHCNENGMKCHPLCTNCH